MILVLIDFDGTITKKDSLADFIQYAVGKPRYYLGLVFLSPLLLSYIFKLIPNYVAKEKIITHFFKDWNVDIFQNLADKYSIEQIDRITRPKAMQKILWHQQNGHKLVIVSASLESWLKKWCDKNNIDLIATRLETQKGKITGKLATKNCYGIEKVKRIKAYYNLSDYSIIYAYGDSAGDKEMLDIATKKHYKYFD